MLSLSCANLMDLGATGQDFLSPGRTVTPRLPRIVTAPNIISDFEGSAAFDTPQPGRRIVVANRLPIRTHCDPTADCGWRFELDPDSIILQLKSGFPAGVEVIYVGSLEADVELSVQEEVADHLFVKFRCVPTFLPGEIQERFYRGFCKNYLWPLFHYMLPLSPGRSEARFKSAMWRAYVSANKIFADKVIEMIDSDEDYVWIHDYHLMILPTFLRKRFNRMKIGFFLHSSFPSSEIYRTIPVRDEILRGLLNADLIGFHTFDYARHFLSCCSRMLGLNYECKRGYIGLEYYGRTVSIKILPIGIHMGQLESIMSMEETKRKVQELQEEYSGKVVLLGVDDLDILMGIGFKFLALEQLLKDHPTLQGTVVLIQILNPAGIPAQDIEEAENEMNMVASRINRAYGSLRYRPIVIVNHQIPAYEKIAYCTIAECCVVNAVRDGMNLVPYNYIVCRQGLPEADDSNRKSSTIIVSEFIGCSPSLSGAIRVNPWNIDDVSNAMFRAIQMSADEKQMRHEKHYKYVSSHDVQYWARSFDQDLERACREHFHLRCYSIGFGLGFRVMALGPNFRKLPVDRIVSAYKKTISRIILLDYDGTMMPQISIDKAPRKEVISVLSSLCSDPRNTIFIVSGRGRDSLGKWFLPCKKLGISAEHGYFTRWSVDSPWESCSTIADFKWKNIAEPVMQLYTEATDGSYIEHKETALVWHHQDSDSAFGSSQAKELLDHLENVLANEPVAVKRGQHIVEVKPYGFSKGIVVQNLISTLLSNGDPLDFVLCIGDDRSDEDMFESIADAVNNSSLSTSSEVFACTVGQKPSKAKYYLEDTTDVIKLLECLANSYDPAKKYSHSNVSFDQPR